MFKHHPFLYGPVFETICQYLNLYDFYRFIQVCKQLQYHAREYRNLIPATKALQLVKKAMRRWSFFRIITRLNGIQSALYAGISYSPYLFCAKHNLLPRRRILPLVHSLHIEYHTEEAITFRLPRHSDFVSSVSWYFYDVKEQPEYCILKSHYYETIDNKFNGIFKEALPLLALPYDDFRLEFPEYTRKSRVYICIKYITTCIDSPMRIKIAKSRNGWTSNTGVQYFSYYGVLMLQEPKVRLIYTPSYKMLKY